MTRGNLRDSARRAPLILVIGAALALAGCGSGDSPPTTSVIALKSPDIAANGVTKPGVTCGYGPMWLDFKWSKPPDETKELALYFARFKYVNGKHGRKPYLTYADLFSGVKPSLRELPANEVPEGASWSYIGKSCPEQRSGQVLIAQIFALDRAAAPRQMERPLATRLAEEALAEPDPHEGPRPAGDLTRDALAVGRLSALDGPPHR